jgi:choloylglycine hydrolase
MKKRPSIVSFILTVITFFLAGRNASFACTDFQIKATDGSVIIGRSMEFAMDVKSMIFLQARGTKVEGGSPDGKAGLTWVSKYGFVALNTFGLEDVVIDGINEAGLSFGGLWLPGTKYQAVSEEETDRAISIGNLGAWILGNFKATEEVKQAIRKLRIWGSIVPELNMEPPMHVAVHDAAGNNIVIEFIEGKINVYDNPLGVMTNAPTFDWHLTNLRNYVNLDCQDAEPLEISGLTLRPTGHGSGMLGIPGDSTPPSRFVRAAMFVHFAEPVENAGKGVSLAAHILNTVDIPHGEIKGKTEGLPVEDYTQWIVIKDLTNKVLYVRDYDNLTLRSVDLKKLKFEPGTKTKSIPTESSENGIKDITAELSQ